MSVFRHRCGPGPCRECREKQYRLIVMERLDEAQKRLDAMQKRVAEFERAVLDVSVKLGELSVTLKNLLDDDK